MRFSLSCVIQLDPEERLFCYRHESVCLDGFGDWKPVSDQVAHLQSTVADEIQLPGEML